VSTLQATILGMYCALLLLCAALIFGADIAGPTVRLSVTPIAADGFKTILGALLGSMSMLMGAKK
jgi:hypothetical protein